MRYQQGQTVRCVKQIGYAVPPLPNRNVKPGKTGKVLRYFPSKNGDWLKVAWRHDFYPSRFVKSDYVESVND